MIVLLQFTIILNCKLNKPTHIPFASFNVYFMLCTTTFNVWSQRTHPTIFTEVETMLSTLVCNRVPPLRNLIRQYHLFNLDGSVLSKLFYKPALTSFSYIHWSEKLKLHHITSNDIHKINNFWNTQILVN